MYKYIMKIKQISTSKQKKYVTNLNSLQKIVNGVKKHKLNTDLYKPETYK